MSRTIGSKPKAGWSAAVSAWYHDPAVRMFNADLAAVVVALLLPWSTTGVIFAVGFWLLAFFFLDLRALPRSLLRPAALLPIAIFALSLIGMLWAEAPWPERLHAIGSTAKLLALPFLLYHFERSPRGVWIFAAFLASCVVLALFSFLVALDPGLSLKLYFTHAAYKVESGIAVRNYIDQSQEFALCAIAIAYPIAKLYRAGSIRNAMLLAAIALGLVTNMVFVVVSRTTLVTLPILIAVLALVHLRWRTALLAIAGVAVLVVALWAVSPHLQTTVAKFRGDYELSFESGKSSGMGSRLEYWRKSLGFVAQAPLFGHGTGSTRTLFERAADGSSIIGSEVVRNPHNQTLTMAVQWGLLGVILLYATWFAHLRLFRGEGLANWVGLVVVVQNILTSLFNSHLFDFTEGWLYVLGVGVAGGMALGQQRLPDERTG